MSTTNVLNITTVGHASAGAWAVFALGQQGAVSGTNFKTGQRKARLHGFTGQQCPWGGYLTKQISASSTISAHRHVEVHDLGRSDRLKDFYRGCS